METIVLRTIPMMAIRVIKDYVKGRDNDGKRAEPKTNT